MIRRATAYVASLLPAAFLVEQAAALKIDTVVVLNPVHERSYSYVAARVPGLRIERISGGSLRVGLALAWRFVIARASGRDVVFFHECCWPLFDILAGAIRPSGAFFPQVTMASFDVVNPSDLGPGRRAAMLRILSRRFTIYRAPKNSGAQGYDYFPSCRAYPPSIRTFPVRPRVVTAAVRKADEGFNVLFIAGTEVGVADEQLRRIYQLLMTAALECGCDVFIKDHPLSRLRVPAVPGCSEIDAAIPIELVDRHFAVAIGCASTALLSVGDRKVAIINALDVMPIDVRKMRGKHLVSLPGAEGVEFPSTLDEVRQMFLQARPAGNR